VLLIDIPTKGLFCGYSKKDDEMERCVSVIHEKGNIYRYQEKLLVKESGGGESTYLDEFKIRYWPSECVKKVLTEIGFEFEDDLSNIFAGAGSYYWLMKKPES
jgi:hypothetical protein